MNKTEKIQKRRNLYIFHPRTKLSVNTVMTLYCCDPYWNVNIFILLDAPQIIIITYKNWYYSTCTTIIQFHLLCCLVDRVNLILSPNITGAAQGNKSKTFYTLHSISWGNTSITHNYGKVKSNSSCAAEIRNKKRKQNIKKNMTIFKEKSTHPARTRNTTTTCDEPTYCKIGCKAATCSKTKS